MKKFHSQLGFTMIELLIVITILGILAVAVLSAINPIEQINRGRDTGSQSDSEQLLSAIDRYNAFQGFFPWQRNADDLDTSMMVDDTGVRVTSAEFDTGLPVEITADVTAAILDPEADPPVSLCHVLERLSTGNLVTDPTLCRGAQELKDSFVTRLQDEGTRTLYVYNGGQAGGSTYVCFIPQSGAFETSASDRCANIAAADPDPAVIGGGLPDDIGEAARNFLCAATGADGIPELPLSCLP
jgi:prepilin-type N-terminal cleavage/methylation domain-containing protein